MPFRRSLALAVVLAGPAPAIAAPCAISGTDVTLYGVSVRAAATTFAVDIHDVPATATVTGGITQLDVGGAIAFKGVVTRGIWYTSSVATNTGTVRLLRGAHFVGLRADGDVLVGSAVLHSMDTMQGENKEPDRAVASVRVDCARLTLDWFADDTEVSVGGTGEYWRPKRHASQLVLHADPQDRSPTVTLSAPHCEGEGCLFVEAIATKGAWMQVGAANENAVVTGWVRASSLAHIPGGIGMGYSYGCTGDHEGSSYAMYPPNQLPRPARIKKGTTIFAEPSVAPWATVVREDDYEVRYAPGDLWAEVTSIPGVTLEAGAAYVLVTSLIQKP